MVQTIVWVDATINEHKPRLAVFFEPAIGGFEADYLMGVLPPRYPVPAIPLVVSYQGVVWPNIVIRTPYSAPIRNQIIRIWKQEG